ncbi:MAG: hypothetical protein HYY67_01960 [Thaumarchaeota archaeon]|nr:hypothetical protein [Nitrososphaerota archaeon]
MISYANMGRFAIIAGLSMLGFLVGFGCYFLVDGLAFYAAKILVNTESVMAIVSGMAGSFLSVFSLMLWEKLTRR